MILVLTGCAPSKPTAADAKKFIDDAEQKLLTLSVEAGRAEWLKNTYIIDDSEIIAAKLDERLISTTVDYANQSTKFDGLTLDPETARKLKLLKLSLTLATPSDPKESEELTRIVAGMEGTYGKGKYCPGGPDLQGYRGLSRFWRETPNSFDVWTGWHAISRPIRKDFVRYVSWPTKAPATRLQGRRGRGGQIRYGASDAGESDPGAGRKPLYLSLHAYGAP